jgi:hypothetical protein
VIAEELRRADGRMPIDPDAAADIVDRTFPATE